MIPKDGDTFLGFDLSTQKLKAVQLDSSLEVLVNAEVKFDTDLPEFRTSGGVNKGANKNEFFVNPVMWVKALDIVLDRLVVQGANLSTVASVGGSAQQHGSVYWSQNGIEALYNLDADKFLHSQIDESSFTIIRTPIWMDGTTDKQCIEMEEAIGGRDEMIHITGSKCYPRFTGPQIRKIYQSKSDCYENTKRISLISSFLASIFIGNIAPIDYGDASGMNLFDINEKIWSKACLNACAPDLEERLGEPVKTCSIIGNIGTFFIQRYGFRHNCKVAAFTGDNLSALSGMAIGRDWLAISLGTSDTIMMSLSEPSKLKEGHILCHPTDTGFMGLLCFRNGSLVRDVFKRVEANNSWEYFSELLDSTPRGNYGNIALHFHSKEIIPNVKGTLRWNKTHTLAKPDSLKGVSKFSSPQTEIRALIEGQMLHHRAVAEDMGFHFGNDTKILATGGASSNKSILQVMADVFNAPVYVQKTTEAALLGGAYRAKYSLYLNTQNVKVSSISDNYYDFVMKHLPNHLQRVCEPNKDCHQIYTPMLERYREMIQILEKQNEG